VKHPESLRDAPHETIYHHMLNKEANKSGVVPEARSLREEAQALMFGGAETVGNALMLGIFHLLKSPSLVKRLKEELRVNWPDLDNTPRFEDLEKLPFLVGTFPILYSAT
jgi:cytochrome P450